MTVCLDRLGELDMDGGDVPVSGLGRRRGVVRRLSDMARQVLEAVWTRFGLALERMAFGF